MSVRRLLALAALVACVLASLAVVASADAYKDWLNSNNVRVDNVNVVDFVGYGSGAEASSKIEADTVLARVPVSMFLNSKVARDDVFKDLVAEYPDVNDQLVLAMLLLAEKYSDQSNFKPWIESMPRKLNTPLYFTETEMEELTGSAIGVLAKSRLEQMRKTYDLLAQFVEEHYASAFPKERFTFDEFKWAVSMVVSRSFTLNLADGAVVALIPGLDMFNHGTAQTEFRFDNETNALVVTTRTAFDKGEQVLINTGKKTNLDLLLSNGYVIDEPEYDVVLLSTRMGENEENRELKRAVLDMRKIPADGFFFLTREKLPDELLVALRIQLAKGQDLIALASSNSTAPVSLENELQVYRTILAACENMFKEYQSTIEEDEKRLKRNLSTNVRSAVRLRKGEKEVLQATVNAIVGAWRDILLYDFPPVKPDAAAAANATSDASAAAAADASGNGAKPARKDEL